RKLAKPEREVLRGGRSALDLNADRRERLALQLSRHSIHELGPPVYKLQRGVTQDHQIALPVQYWVDTQLGPRVRLDRQRQRLGRREGEVGAVEHKGASGLVPSDLSCEQHTRSARERFAVVDHGLYRGPARGSELPGRQYALVAQVVPRPRRTRLAFDLVEI